MSTIFEPKCCCLGLSLAGAARLEQHGDIVLFFYQFYTLVLKDCFGCRQAFRALRIGRKIGPETAGKMVSTADKKAQICNSVPV